MNENMLKAMSAIYAGEKADGRSVAALKKRGFLTDDGEFTPAGREAFLDSVPTDTITTLTLGTTLSRIRDGNGRVGAIKKGAELIVVFAGRTKDRYKQRWFDCFLSKEFPIIRVLANSSHKFSTHRVPKTEEVV